MSRYREGAGVPETARGARQVDGSREAEKRAPHTSYPQKNSKSCGLRVIRLWRSDLWEIGMAFGLPIEAIRRGISTLYRPCPMLRRLLERREAAEASSGIGPPPDGFQIARSPKDWWKTS